VTFIIDAQLPPALARSLRALGCEAFAVRELGLRDATDALLWNYALQYGAAIVTKDEDFAQRCLSSQAQPVIIWLRVGSSSNARYCIGSCPSGRSSRSALKGVIA